MQGIVTCFLSEIDGMHLDIRQALQVMDMTQIQHAAHKLRGSCGTVGLRQVQADALAIEMAAKKADHVLLEQAVANLERHLAESLTRLAAFSAET